MLPVPFVGPADGHVEGWSPPVQDFLCSSVGTQPSQWPFPQPLSFLIRFFQLLLVCSYSRGATATLVLPHETLLTLPSNSSPL